MLDLTKYKEYEHIKHTTHNMTPQPPCSFNNRRYKTVRIHCIDAARHKQYMQRIMHIASYVPIAVTLQSKCYCQTRGF